MTTRVGILLSDDDESMLKAIQQNFLAKEGVELGTTEIFRKLIRKEFERLKLKRKADKHA